MNASFSLLTWLEMTVSYIKNIANEMQWHDLQAMIMQCYCTIKMVFLLEIKRKLNL